jgi:hypothetical protein
LCFAKGKREAGLGQTESREMMSKISDVPFSWVVCGHCAHIVKLEQRNMIDGARVLGHGELFTATPPGTVVFSY